MVPQTHRMSLKQVSKGVQFMVRLRRNSVERTQSLEGQVLPYATTKVQEQAIMSCLEARDS